MHHTHRVRVHFWRDAALIYLDNLFASEAEAMSFAKHYEAKADTAVVKVYDANDHVRHSHSKITCDPSIYG
jgi:hypothetical protein